MVKTFTVSADHLHPSMPWTARDQLWIKEFEEKYGVKVDPDNIALVRQLLDAERLEEHWKGKEGEAAEHAKKWGTIKENALSLLKDTALPDGDGK
jgi:hypothetical protein